ncbi:MAG: hypothetical protein ACIAXF_04730 [Phycisphaerales bacterium JB063]
MPDHATTADRHAALTRMLAGRALEMAVDAAPHRPAQGSARYSMLHAAPAARVLLGADDSATLDHLADQLLALASAAADPAHPPELTDGQGHHRPVYGPLCVHLMLSALAVQRSQVVERLGDAWASRVSPIMTPIRASRVEDAELDDAELMALPINTLLWRALCELEWALLTNQAFDGALAMRVIERVQNLVGADGALHPQTADDTPDAWVYRELTGLHALHLASQVGRGAGWAARCAQVSAYHLDHTQPDYTTYQPWALSAFAEGESTAVFAEQQLHDVQTHLAIEGPGGALLPGLLLADAAASLDGRIVGAWQRYRFQG